MRSYWRKERCCATWSIPKRFPRDRARSNCNWIFAGRSGDGAIRRSEFELFCVGASFRLASSLGESGGGGLWRAGSLCFAVRGRDGKEAGPLVERIDFEGMRCVSVETVRGKVRTKQEAPYDAAVAESDAQRLRDTGNYTRVAVHVETARTGR